MFVKIKNQQGEVIMLNAALIEAIYELRDGGSEIIVTSGRRYTTLESAEKLSERIQVAQALSKA